jgi:Uma2 family endonuclease
MAVWRRNQQRLIAGRIAGRLLDPQDKRDLCPTPSMVVRCGEVLCAPGVMVFGGIRRREATVLEPEEVFLVCEVTTPTTRLRDLTVKPGLYAGAGIPVLLLVDWQEDTVTLLTDPSEDVYRTRTTVRFGERLVLPEPFLPLDTGFGIGLPATRAAI